MAEKKEKATIPQYKFFIGSINTVLGQAITETVRNDHLNDINPHIIFGNIKINQKNY